MIRGILWEKTQGYISEFCMYDCLRNFHSYTLLFREGFISINFSDNYKDTDQDYQDDETESDLIFFQMVLLSKLLCTNGEEDVMGQIHTRCTVNPI